MSRSKRKHRYRHSRLYRIRRWIRHNKKQTVLFTVLGVIFVLGLVVWMRNALIQQSNRHITAGNSIDMGSGYRRITYNGKEYQYNSLITTVLYAGVDSEGVLETMGSYTDAPRADSINLVILDKKNQRMTIMPINRDTMTEIRRYTVSGKDRGTYTSHLGLAYTYGDGGKVSCENLREAVSKLLGDIPINEYVVTNRSSMPYINQLVGGVMVTVPNDDLAENYPEFQKGASVKLDDTNIEAYLRSRDTEEDFSNEGRMERQRSYMSAYVEQFKIVLEEDLSDTWNKVEKMNKYLQTSITKNKYINLANLLKRINFDENSFSLIEGQDAQGELHDEFYVDETALQEKIIELFYEEI
ncbi:MAG: LCP family protein [Lachnospiraceae bacterium]|nr:LCP family protein [Lachnospiraceae bacterium]